MTLGFALGFLLSAVASVPALWLLKNGRGSEFKHLLALWAIGVAIRFVLIGCGLLALFMQTSVARIPAVAGVGAAYVISYVFEARALRRSK